MTDDVLDDDDDNGICVDDFSSCERQTDRGSDREAEQTTTHRQPQSETQADGNVLGCVKKGVLAFLSLLLGGDFLSDDSF